MFNVLLRMTDEKVEVKVKAQKIGPELITMQLFKKDSEFKLLMKS